MTTPNKTAKSNNHGGARPGAGRPRGSGNRVNLEDLMLDLELETHMPFTQRLAINYQAAIARADWNRVENYDRAFLNKLVGDRQEIRVDNTQDVRLAKEQAFTEALASLQNVAVLNTKTKTGT